MKTYKNKAIKLVVAILVTIVSLIGSVHPVYALLSTVSGDDILWQAQQYDHWDYYDVGTCTGLVSRVAEDLGIARNVNGYMVGDMAKYSPEQMYNNALNNPDDTQFIWQGYLHKVSDNAHLLKNGDLVIQIPDDKIPYDGFGHVGFLRKTGTTISMYSANNPVNGVSDAMLATGMFGTPLEVDERSFVRIFRLVDDIKPNYQKLSATKEATEQMEITVLKSDEDTSKVLSYVEFDFYRDDVKFATVVSDENGIARATSTQNFTANSSQKEYVTNFSEISDAIKQDIINKGIYQSQAEAKKAADKEAQDQANLLANQTHTFKVVETKTKHAYYLDSSKTTSISEQTGSGIIHIEMTNKRVQAKLQLIRHDKDLNSTTPQGEGTLDGAVYGLYARKDIVDPADGIIVYPAGTLIQKGTTMNSKINIDLGYIGSVYWKEISPSVGYEKDETEYDVELK